MSQPLSYNVRRKRTWKGTPTFDAGTHRPLYELQCPQCGVWAELDADQLMGTVSTACPTPGCEFHTTVRFSDFIREGDIDDSTFH
jgi:hypothetical protein